MPRPADRRRLLAWSVFAALLVGQIGLGAGLILLREALITDGCERRCPCDAPVADTAEAPAEALADMPAEAQAADHAAAPCPPGCDDCTCCPGAIAAIITTDLPTLRAPLGLPVTRPPPDEPATGVNVRLDRPPDDTRG
ncbi:MAG: hypothetical protein H6703_15560 [Myxococcales bacterium]|nr:hypothetical protein [Myxococcales bacterium]MCB9543848.1 hypothetical protein [Myxococcales bacterium]MCB9553285.1 hypothetical protein [Myxococcales bacterium]